MNDKEFLKWLHNRLVNVYHIDHDLDYMHKFRAIINDYPNEKITSSISTQYEWDK